MNKKYLIGIVFLAALVSVSVFLWHNYAVKKDIIIPSVNENAGLNNQTNQSLASPPIESPIPKQNITDFQAPLSRVLERVTKKPFGIYITPQTSPVQPEKFQGYHTGTDFEIFPEELKADVPVKAVCSGKLVMKKYVSGYGGVMVESCELNKNPITVIYGHLKLASISKSTGENIIAGETLGILGANKSIETDGERKHLHLGFHKGAAINILGYVQSKSALSDWLDPCVYVCF